MATLPQSLLIEIIAAALEDPLIDSRAEQTIVIFVWVLILALAGVIGLFSRRLEQVLFFAFISTIITMAFFVIH